MKSFEINDFRPLTLDCFAFAFACALISYIGILSHWHILTVFALMSFS